ncbi:P-loop containing nucleoside triphosphate hydrolase protein [Sistotremastrum suecicum HHB10207 ss-3]|uniref:RNA helicase n=1 Tax=Sistotremastrum suecicum HHB10207 ss-3 TaxID=1314776 RepID=A0A166HGA4_9AGAM|nr:P-loop containing nucleoside triphosphate hydrolase protein [Sistotremastrum suecicum HHB10207 ss-3]
MPKGRGIVKSGLAGNSKKAKAPAEDPSTSENTVKPLFPPGSKFPLSLLNERCQKHGWERPLVETREKNGEHSFSVILRRQNKKTSEQDSVRLEPHPPYFRPSALEARHWGATYALYRICNNLSLQHVLPAGPRQYWNELADEHKKAPGHLKWMYDPDPFSARKEVARRQEAAAKRQEDSEASHEGRGLIVSREFEKAPEVKMSLSLRELVEQVIRKHLPDMSRDSESYEPFQSQEICKQLELMGFSDRHVASVVPLLQRPSFLAGLNPLEASIEYLLLKIPECDLPSRFLGSEKSSEPIIMSTHSGNDALRSRWIHKVAMEAGWPEHVVKACSEGLNELDLSSLILALDHLSIGQPENHSIPTASLEETELEIRDAARTDELSAVQSVYSSAYITKGTTYRTICVPIEEVGLTLHIVLAQNHPYPLTESVVPMYLSSKTIPAYLRIHLLTQTLFKYHDLHQPGVGVMFSAIDYIIQEWQDAKSSPPDLHEIMARFTTKPRPSATPQVSVPVDVSEPLSQHIASRRKTKDTRSNEQITQDFKKMTSSSAYQTMFKIRCTLPAFTVKEDFLRVVDSNRVVVVVGETGSGKTTQLPQFILDACIEAGRGRETSIIVTQPRRVAAMAVANRVAAERAGDQSVGYTTRGESRVTAKTKILFCTIGVALRRLSDGLADVSHIVIDEVHERSLDSDFLLLELKAILERNARIKVILMSATINHDKFVAYFGHCPVLAIPGRIHPVTDIYLEEFIQKSHYRPSLTGNLTKWPQERLDDFKLQYEQMGLDSQAISSVEKLVRSSALDYQLIASIVADILTRSSQCGILVFLSGTQEIQKCIDVLHTAGIGTRAKILPLHAGLSSEEQSRIFSQYPMAKIVVATNVAETSITIDDIEYVIDSGKAKEIQQDSETELSRLAEDWVSRAAARQRRGRAGRTGPGVCYKLYTRAQENDMSPFPVPEIQRVPLESMLLTMKVIAPMTDPRKSIAGAIDPPDVGSVDRSWATLQIVGCIDESGDLTALGEQVSHLPLDIRLAKMLILGAVFHCLDPMLTIAAALSSKPLFISSTDKREETSLSRAKFSIGNSDVLTVCAAFNEALHQERISHASMQDFCRQNSISLTTVREIQWLRNDFKNTLRSMGFTVPSPDLARSDLQLDTSQQSLVKSIVLGGLWPRVARIHLPSDAIKFDRVQAGAVQRENEAREFRLYDVVNDTRVFIHPSSGLFGNSVWKSKFVAFFTKRLTSKIFIQDVTEVPTYALLLFGGQLTVNHVGGGLTVKAADREIRLRAWPRIGVLVNHLRRLLDERLRESIQNNKVFHQGTEDPVIEVIRTLLVTDGSA